MTQPFDILLETDDLLAINKPANLSVLRDRSGAPNLWAMINSTRKHYLIHRLDKGTSGVLLIGKSQRKQSELTRAFTDRRVRKFYLAQVVGEFPRGQTLTIDLPLRKGRKSRYRVAGLRDDIARELAGWRLARKDNSGVDATTRVRAVGFENGKTWLIAQPITGRTHQLRVHLAWIGFPIVGDHLYGSPKDPVQAAERLKLHCRTLVLPEGVQVCARSYPPSFP